MLKAATQYTHDVYLECDLVGLLHEALREVLEARSQHLGREASLSGRVLWPVVAQRQPLPQLGACRERTM